MQAHFDEDSSWLQKKPHTSDTVGGTPEYIQNDCCYIMSTLSIAYYISDALHRRVLYTKKKGIVTMKWVKGTSWHYMGGTTEVSSR